MPSRLQDGFNLRTSEEKDEIERSRLGGFDASIHISMRERPRHDGANKIALAVSIHAPLRERRGENLEHEYFEMFQFSLP